MERTEMLPDSSLDRDWKGPQCFPCAPSPTPPYAPGPLWAFAAPLLWGARKVSVMKHPGGGKRQVNIAVVGDEAEPAQQRLQRSRGQICPAVHPETAPSLESR